MCRQIVILVGTCLNNLPSRLLFYMAHNVIVSEIVSQTSVAAVYVQSEIGKRMLVVDFVHRSITFYIVFQEL